MKKLKHHWGTIKTFPPRSFPEITVKADSIYLDGHKKTIAIYQGRFDGSYLVFEQDEVNEFINAILKVLPKEKRPTLSDGPTFSAVGG
jgi:hypothetical protein